MNEKTEDTRTYYLWWEKTLSGKRTPAGVAFHNAEFGEFKIKIDSIEFLTSGDGGLEKAQIYCKAVGSFQDRIEYRVEKVIKKPGQRFLKRFRIGDGFSDSTTKGEIHIDLPPYTSGYKLILVQEVL